MPCRASAAAVAESTPANSISRRISHGREAQLAPIVRLGSSSTISRTVAWSRRRNVQIGKSILAGEVGEPCHRSGAEVFDVRRQAPPGIGVERCAADLCEIAELTEKGGEV